MNYQHMPPNAVSDSNHADSDNDGRIGSRSSGTAGGCGKGGGSTGGGGSGGGTNCGGGGDGSISGGAGGYSLSAPMGVEPSKKPVPQAKHTVQRMAGGGIESESAAGVAVVEGVKTRSSPEGTRS
eukprot:3749002-Pleurochrysis_carterae.AAC.1